MGCLFKKTYWDDLRKKNCSKLVGPKDLIVNYWATSLETAHRKTEVMQMTRNELTSHQNMGLYLDVELPEPKNVPNKPSIVYVNSGTPPGEIDFTTPYVI